MLDAGGGLGLAQEPRLRGGVGGVPREHDLEGQPAVEAGVERGVDRPHAAAAEFLDDAVRPETADLARLDRRPEGGRGRCAGRGLRHRLVLATGDGPLLGLRWYEGLPRRRSHDWGAPARGC